MCLNDIYFFAWLMPFLFFYNCKITKSANRVLGSLLRLSFHRSANISKSRNNRSALNACAIRALLIMMILQWLIMIMWKNIMMSFFSFHLFLSLFFTLFYIIQEGWILCKKKNFLPSVALSCSPRFLYSISFASLLLVLLSVFPNHPFITLLIAHAHIRLQT